MKHILITGATSSLGVSLVEVCLARGHQVTVLARANTGHLERLPQSPKLQVIDFDLSQKANRENDKVQKAQCDVFYHLAWCGTGKADRRNVILQQKNIQYTLDMIELANRLGCKKFIGAGSQAEYGSHTQLPTGPDSLAMPDTAYGISKYAAGRLGAALAKEVKMDFFWVRLFSVYGKYDRKDTLIQSILDRKEEEHYTFTVGTHIWDYLYSADAAQALYLIGEKARGNKVYCLGCGKARTLKDYVEELRDIAAPNVVLRFDEKSCASEEIGGICADISLLQQDTGWLPVTDFSQGIYALISG